MIDSILGAPVDGAARIAPDESLDAAGAAWDPDDHQDPPSKDKRGRWKRRRGRRPSAAPSGRTRAADPRNLSGAPIGGQPGIDEAEPDPGIEYATLARVTVVSLTSGLTIAFGDAWKAAPAESDAMCQAWEAYFRARGIRDVPPEVLLAGAMTAYVAPRIARPETRGALGRAWGRWKTWRRSKAPVGDFDARADRRADGFGENHAAPASVSRLPSRGDPGGRLVSDPPRV